LFQDFGPLIQALGNRGHYVTTNNSIISNGWFDGLLYHVLQGGLLGSQKEVWVNILFQEAIWITKGLRRGFLEVSKHLSEPPKKALSGKGRALYFGGLIL